MAERVLVAGVDLAAIRQAYAGLCTATRPAVEGATVALQHNIGLGGAAVVTLYEKVS